MFRFNPNNFKTGAERCGARREFDNCLFGLGKEFRISKFLKSQRTDICVIICIYSYYPFTLYIFYVPSLSCLLLRLYVISLFIILTQKFMYEMEFYALSCACCQALKKERYY